MSHELSPEQRADMQKQELHTNGVWDVLRGLLFFGLSVGYYFLGVSYESNPPKRVKAVFYAFHGIFGTRGGSAFLVLIGVIFLALGINKLIKSRKIIVDSLPK